MRATLSVDDEGRRVATPFTRQDSSMLATLAGADCLIRRPVGAPPARAGERVEYVALSGGCLSV